MVYAYDKWMQLPVRDLYDTQMMLAAVNAAKDMYEKGLQQIKDFKKEYGDFYSPVQSDMDWYKENVTDPVVNTINDLYAKGIDPIRSVEGRAAVSKLINSVNTGEIAQKKRQAEAAESYIKSRDVLKKAGLWNPEYERQMLGGQLLEEWDGSLGNWTATSASPYQDYHQKYNHLFKDMDYEYDEEESKKHPGMIAMTRSKSRMHDILNSVRKDLENDPQYQYDLNNFASLVQLQNPDLSSEDALSTARRMLEDEIVERNYKGGMKLEIDPVWKDQQDYKQQVALAHLRSRLSAQTPTVSPYEQSYARDMYMTAIGRIFNVDMYTASEAVQNGSAGKRIFFKEQEILKNNNFDVDKCINAHTSSGNIKSNAVVISIPLGGNISKNNKSVTLNSSTQFSKAAMGDKKVYDASELVFNTAGYRKRDKDRNKEQEQNKKLLEKATSFTVTSDNVGHLHKSGQFRTYVKVIGNNGAVGYVRAHIDSNKKYAGQAYSSLVKDRDQDLGWDAQQIGSIKQRDLSATKLYTKSGDANNNAALEPEIE